MPVWMQSKAPDKLSKLPPGPRNGLSSLFPDPHLFPSYFQELLAPQYAHTSVAMTLGWISYIH